MGGEAVRATWLAALVLPAIEEDNNMAGQRDTRFAPGPWYADGCRTSPLEHIILDGNSGNPLLRIRVLGQAGRRIRTDEPEAIARLIAQAPMMYKLLELARDYLDLQWRGPGLDPGGAELLKDINTVLGLVKEARQ